MDNERVACPWCAEQIMPVAIVCPHCNRTTGFVEVPAAPPKESSGYGVLAIGLLVVAVVVLMMFFLIS